MIEKERESISFRLLSFFFTHKLGIQYWVEFCNLQANTQCVLVFLDKCLPNSKHILLIISRYKIDFASFSFSFLIINEMLLHISKVPSAY